MGHQTVHSVDEVYRFVVQYKQAHDGNSPSLQEIGRACGIRSTSHVYLYLVRLADAGRIKLAGTRSIEVIGGRWVFEKGA